MAAMLLAVAACAGGPARAAEPATDSALALITAVLPSGAPGERSLVFIAEFPTTGLAAEDGGIQGELRLRVTDARGGELRSVGEPFVLGSEAADGRPLAGIKLFGELPLAAGRYSLEATLVGPSGAQLASTRQEVEVPAPAVGSWIASMPLSVDDRPGWRAFRANSLPASGQPFPFTRPDGTVFLPRAEPELGAGSTAELVVLVASASGNFPALRAELTPAGGGPAQELTAELEGATPSRIAGVTVARLAIDLPRLTGRSTLRVLFDGGASPAVTAGLPVRLDGAPAQDEGEDEAPGGGAVGPVTIAPGSLAAGYVQALRALAAKGPEAAAADLAAFEQSVLTSDRGRRLRELRQAEEAVAKQVADRDDTAWRAIIGLHVEADAVYVAARDPWLVAQGRRFVVRLVRLGRLQRRPEDRAFAADALALLAPAEALEIDPRHRLALLRAAIAEERSFRFSNAADLLRRLLAVDPDDAQARLRLGVDLRQLGDAEASRRELERVIAGAAPSWIHELAYGQLAGLEHDRGRLDRAEEVLRAGIEKVSAEQLYLQLAFYLEERNRSREAVQWVNRMPVEEGQERASARHVYTQDPEREIAAVRERMLALARQARAALAGGLGDLPAGGST